MSDSTLPPLPSTVLVIGAGGREHALVRACRKSGAVKRILAAPGNGGMAEEAECFPVSAEDVDGLVALAVREKPDFVIIGPEAPLTLGLADRLKDAGIAVYGPGEAGARLEASKVFTKDLLLKHGIPTADGMAFTEIDPAIAFLRAQDLPVVVKADGLAAGKGVIVATTHEEAEMAVRDMLEGGKFGDSGRRVLIEEGLVGDETSIHLIVSGRDFVLLPTAQDHKRIGDGDTGPNTGGMGTYSPAAWLDNTMLDRIVREIARPSVDAIAAEGIDFCGTLFIGLMITGDGPKVLEYNVRFGDPETQVLLPRLKTDVLELLWAAAHGKLADIRLDIDPTVAICVVIAARGYPGSYPKGEPIGIPDSLPPGVSVIHAGTAMRDGALVSNGGRVLGITATAPQLDEAAKAAYTACASIDFPSKVYRRDIGARQLR